MPKLTIQSGVEAGRVFRFTGGAVRMGRSVNNDLQIVDRRMSRNHTEIFFKDGAYFVRDLESKNGTLHNGSPVLKPIKLNFGDLVQLGDSTILFEDDTSDYSADMTSLMGSPAGVKRKDASGYRLVDERQWGATRGELRAGIPAKTSVTLSTDQGRALKDTNKRLEILYQVTEAIRSVFALDELLEQIMEIITNVIQPDRAYLLLADKQTGELVPEVIKSTNKEEDVEVKISTSIVERCMNEGVSLLVSDAAQDDRFAASESIIMNRIRTAMVAPLIYKGETLGVVYIDTHTRMLPFSQEELELLTGITNQAALAISNARLHAQLVEQHKLAREMEIARTIQMNLLPKVYPDLDGYEISAMSLPAKHVGGDYYDFLKLPDDRIGLAIADVSGKGVPAAILTATTRSYLQSETQHPSSTIAETVERINRMVHRDVTNDMYVTMALIYMDPNKGEIEYVNAGHSHPVLMDKHGEIRFLDQGGLFLGIIEENSYESAIVKMSPGDVLLLDTDGVTDIQNMKGEPFGAERLYELMRKCIHLSSEGMRNAIYQACLKHRGDAEQFDDFTMIVLKRLNPEDSSFDEMDFD